MSRTKKDLKSNKEGFGNHYPNKPSRKMKPLAINASIISGERTNLVFIDNDISQDGFEKGEHWHNAKGVKSIRKQLVDERQNEKSTARGKINKQTKKDVEEALEILKDKSPWIKIEEGCEMPKEQEIIDLWVDGQRFTDYVFKKNYNGIKGNNFFAPTKAGVSVIIFEKEELYTKATHWMYPIKGPKK